MSLKKCRDLILGVVMLLFSGFYLYNAQSIKTRPKLTPSYASARIMLSVLCIIQGVRRMKSADEKAASGRKLDRGDLMAVLFTFAVIIGYVMVLPTFGFILATPIYLFLQMTILSPSDKRNYVLFAVISVVFTVFVFVAFRIGLQQLLPRGVIESLIGF